MTVLLIILGIVALVVIWGISVYNGLIGSRVNTQNAWSQIDVQLKRRHDLIPNLVETVKGYASHEKETLENVIKMRNVAVAAGQSGNVGQASAAEGQLSGALRQLFALSEAYPDLKANANFAQLTEELTSTENKISFARQHYNDSVGSYNTSAMLFPASIIAGMFGFAQREFFELDAGEAEQVKQAPKVSF
jgi:LemA protein